MLCVRLAQVLASLGAEIVENVPMPNARHGIPTYFVNSRVEAASNLHRFDGVKYGYRTQKPVQDLTELYRVTRAEGFGLQPKLRILMGMYVSAAAHAAHYYQKALRLRSLIRADFERAFDPSGPYRLDALLTPTTPTTAFRRKEVLRDTVLMQYSDQMTVGANHAGIPAISIPAGLDPHGLRLGYSFLVMTSARISSCGWHTPTSKQQSSLPGAKWFSSLARRGGEIMTQYEIVVGLETHIQLNTKTKIFCSCKADSWGAEPIPTSARSAAVSRACCPSSMPRRFKKLPCLPRHARRNQPRFLL
jgi:hypothetical protein